MFISDAQIQSVKMCFVLVNMKTILANAPLAVLPPQVSLTVIPVPNVGK